MSRDEFIKLFTYLESFRADVNQRFDSIERRVGDLESTVSEFGSQLKDLREEVMVISRNDSRQDRRIKELADHTGAKLSSA
jgi:hypothetical protein